KRKYRKNIVSKELYDAWKLRTGYNISFQEFRKIWRLIAQEYITSIVEEADGVRLDASTGDLYIGYIPSPKRKPIDFNTSLQLGKRVHFQNWNSSGKMAKIIYGTRGRRYMYRFATYWSFVASRTFKKRCKQALQDY